MHTRDGRFISQIGIKTLGMIVNILMSDLKKGVLISWFVLNYHKVSRSETLSLSPGLKARLSHHIPTKKAKSDVRTNFDFQTIKNAMEMSHRPFMMLSLVSTVCQQDFTKTTERISVKTWMEDGSQLKTDPS